MKKFNDMEKFSYFKKGVNKTAPAAEATLGKVYAMIRSFRLKELTGYIREGLAAKTEVLPSVTFSGTFNPRCDSGLKKYSSLICMDVDHQDYPHLIRDRICWDRFLNPCLIFISPRGHGLKIIIRVKDGIPENHDLYFDAIALYLKGAYGIEADKSGRNISRLCFICHDPEPFFFEDGFVSSEALLKLQPVETRHCLVSDTPDRFPKPVRCTTAFVDAISKKQYKKSAVSPFYPADESPSDRLNQISAVHELAKEALQRHGWKQKGNLWTRPGKELRQGCSAIYNLYPPEGIHILTNFSSNGHPFQQNKSYSDCQIICELDYGGDFKRCISELAQRYLEPN